MQAVAAAVGSSLTVIKEVVRPMSKQERWQARKYLIGRGRSIYPDARIAAQRLAQNNVAVEKAKLAQNVYNTTNPLAATPGVPEGWRDVSNDGGFWKNWNFAGTCFLIMRSKQTFVENLCT